MDSNSAIAVLTAMITPAVLISACGSMILSTSSRLGRVVDRVRGLSDKWESMTDDEKQTVDVSVDFPKGVITEWYPQASQIGPSTIPAPAPIAKADDLAHKAGAKPDLTFASLLKNHAARESRARWTDIEILPVKESSRVNTSRITPTFQLNSRGFL